MLRALPPQPLALAGRRGPHPVWFFLLLWAAVTTVALVLYLAGSF